MAAADRTLIVNADDFGLSAGVNAGILESHERGIVTSTSLMVRHPAAAEAAGAAEAHPSLAFGLHLDLGQWEYADGEWIAGYERCSLEDRAEVEAECEAQLEAFRALLGRDPTHIDSHQHVHSREPVAAVARAMASRLGVPLRAWRGRYEGGFYGQTGTGEPLPEAIAAERLIELIVALPAGVTELGCHPGRGLGDESSYAAERDREVTALCDPRVRATVEAEGIELRSFAELRAADPPQPLAGS